MVKFYNLSLKSGERYVRTVLFVVTLSISMGLLGFSERTTPLEVGIIGLKAMS
jgi:hypothetical protein